MRWVNWAPGCPRAIWCPRIVGPPMHVTMADLVGDRAGEAMTAYRADYTTRGGR